MKILLLALGILVIAASIYADYRWRKWMAARREEVFQYLSELPVDAWERPFRHPNWGQLKFYQMVNILPQHDKLHAQQLADIKAAETNE